MNKFLSSPFLIFLLVLVLVGFIAVAGKESYRKYQIDKEVGGIKKEIESLKEKNKALSNLLDYFGSEESLEKEARLKLNLLKEGEKLVIITPDKKTDSENQFPEDTQKEKVSNFDKWLKYFGVDPHTRAW